MKVCAHYNVGDAQFHMRQGSIADAIYELRATHDKFGFDTVMDVYVDKFSGTKTWYSVQADAVQIYPECDDCTDTENHHDYPIAMFAIGVRGGVTRVTI